MGFYVYTWLREDGSPYYVGKGCGGRAYSSDKHHRPPDPSCIHVFPMLDEATAFAYECYLIDFWGRKDLGTGILRNLTDGGEGVHGKREITQEHREKIRQSKLGKPRSLAIRRKIRLGHLGRKQTPQHIENARRTRLGKKQTSEHTESIRLARSAPPAREHMRQLRVGKHWSQEVRDKIAEGQRRKWRERRSQISLAPAC